MSFGCVRQSHRYTCTPSMCSRTHIHRHTTQTDRHRQEQDREVQVIFHYASFDADSEFQKIIAHFHIYPSDSSFFFPFPIFNMTSMKIKIRCIPTLGIFETRGFTIYPRLVSNSRPSWLSFLRARTTSVCHSVVIYGANCYTTPAPEPIP